jgi:hypothetical protein
MVLPPVPPVAEPPPVPPVAEPPPVSPVSDSPPHAASARVAIAVQIENRLIIFLRSSD